MVVGIKKKFNKKVFLVFFILIFSLVPTYYVKSDGGNWLNGWDYRKQHTINGSTSDIQNDYSINIIVHYSSGSDSDNEVYLNSNCKTDFGDIRFTNSSGKDLLDYWIEEKTDSDNAVFWVEVDYIPISPDNVNIYIYYGNDDATTTSNGTNTFISWDDFDLGYSENDNPKEDRGWTTSGTTDGNYIKIKEDPSDSENLVIRIEETGDSVNTILKQTLSVKYPSISVHYRMRRGQSRTYYVSVYEDASVRITINLDWTLVRRRFYDGSSYEEYDPQCPVLTHNNWRFFTEKIDNETTNKYVMMIGESSYIGGLRSVITDGINVFTFHNLRTQVGTLYIDRFFIRKLCTPEPEHDEWGEEESIQPPLAPNLLFGAGFNGSSSYVELHWNHSMLDVQLFEVQNSSDNIIWEYLGQTTTTNYTDNQVVNGTIRYYKVRACNQTGIKWYNSSFSNINLEKVYFIPEIGDGELISEDYAGLLIVGLILGIVIGVVINKS